MKRILRYLRRRTPTTCGVCGRPITPGRAVKAFGNTYCSIECAADDFDFSSP